MSKSIAVIGAGISGLSSALLLAENSYNVTIIAKAFSPNITSNKAAAFWFPYHIRNDSRGINWCRISYKYYEDNAANPDTGISMQTLHKVLRKGVVAEEPVWVEFMPKGSYTIKRGNDVDEIYDAIYEVRVPLIETQIFLPYLMNVLQQLGVTFIEKEIDSFDELNNYDVIINCSALGSRKLCNDDLMIPVRGQVGLLSPKEGLPIYLDNEKPLYVVPRKDAIIVGGTYEEYVETDDTEPATIQRLLHNAYEIFPALKTQEVIGDWAGLRPYRPDVRVEHEAGTNIIHNYGHGGSGFTLAFGCANEVLQLASSI